LDYKSLLHKRLLGTLTEQERKALDAWLHDSPQHQREKKQFERLWNRTSDYKKSYQPDVERGLSDLKARMQQQQKETVTAKKTQLKPRRFGWRIAATIAVLLTVGALLFTYFNNTPEYVTIAAAAGTQQEVTLEDGTHVLLNSNSTLRYPEAFAKNLRTVELEGEAFFEVAENSARPFIIKLPQTKVTVLGTAFNVRAYLDENFTEVTVQSGKVRFTISKTGQSKTLTDKQKATYTHDTAFSVGRDDELHALSWLAGDLVFENERVSTIIEQLERYYKVNLELTETNIGACRISLVNRNYPSLEKVLGSLEESLQVEVEHINQKSYQITHGICPE